MWRRQQWFVCAVTSSILLIPGACTDSAYAPEIEERKKPRPDAGADAGGGGDTSADTEAPTAPVVNVTASGPTYISLAWSSTDNRDTILVYQVAIDGVSKTPSSMRSQTFQLLKPETTYTFTVRARDNHLNWSPTTTTVVTTPAIDRSDVTPPTTPSPVWCEGYGDLEMQCAWQASTDNATDQVAILYFIYANGVHENTAVGKAHTPSVYGVSGDNVITVVAVDEAGNRSEAGSTTITLP